MIRRNGKPRSCEPCRLAKVRCDHTSPTCRRCDERGMGNMVKTNEEIRRSKRTDQKQCFYHPAPLTRQRRQQKFKSPVELPASLSFPRGTANPQSRPVPELQYNLNDAQTRGVLQPPSQPRPADWSLQSETFYSTNEATQSMSGGYDDPTFKEGLRLLSLFHDFAPFQTLLETYWKICEPSVIPAPLIMNALPSVRATLENHINGRSHLLVKLLAENTSLPFRVPTSITASNFHTLYTGDNIRWEFLGTIFAMAGLTAQLTSSQQPSILPNDPSTENSNLIAYALEASNSCISICQNYNSANDLMLWLLSMNLFLLCNCRGDSGIIFISCIVTYLTAFLTIIDHAVWRRMGDVSTDIFALGWHQEQPASIPFFLSESRKRLFASAYRCDKSLASFLGRPPRIAKRYCTLAMPSDLSDEDLMRDESEIKDMLATYDQYGWRTDTRLKPAAWIRLRFQHSILREDILELSQGAITDGTSDQLQ
ncbi:hypothetical protein N7454_005812 [Penicillium verhagenii]|nr:hypothetical protein N7454_005812 [Penicillium verhagenii]